MGRYSLFESFAEEHPELTEDEFYGSLSGEIGLFSTGEDFDFASLQAMLSAVKKVLPSVKRIFRKPIIELAEEDRIVPVEAAGRIDSKSVAHLASHPELWDKIENGELTPRQLLSKTYKDNYVFYENLVVVSFVDQVLSYIRKRKQNLRNLLYSSHSFNVNLLDRDNHPNYYKGLEKLQGGYLNNFKDFADNAIAAQDELKAVEDSISLYLNRPVYRYCHKVHKKLPLHKTNILGMQKDYHRVYAAYRNLFSVKKNRTVYTRSEEDEKEGYPAFVKALLIFSLLNYGFTADPEQKICLENLHLAFDFRGTALSVEEKQDGNLLLNFSKDRTYGILLVLNEKGEKDPSARRALPVGPYEKDGVLFLSSDDIESFRRLQQVFLSGIVNAADSFASCPFCGEEMRFDKRSGEYFCPSCRETIKKKTCPETGKEYYETAIRHYRLSMYSGDDPYEKKRSLEALYRFRNITPVGENGELLCPYCRKEH